jgi:hypothetical protein
MTGTTPRPVPHRKNLVTLLGLSAFVGGVCKAPRHALCCAMCSIC